MLDHLKLLEDQETLAQNGGLSKMDPDEEWSVDGDDDDDGEDNADEMS